MWADLFERRAGVQAEGGQRGFERALALVVPEGGAAHIRAGRSAST
jgi:hypothetical protein